MGILVKGRIVAVIRQRILSQRKIMSLKQRKKGYGVCVFCVFCLAVVAKNEQGIKSQMVSEFGISCLINFTTV